MPTIRTLLILFAVELLRGQEPALKPPSDVVRDRIGRSTPRGTVFGFLSAAHQGDFAVAAQYLDTPLKGTAANELASEFVVVLDRGCRPAWTK